MRDPAAAPLLHAHTCRDPRERILYSQPAGEEEERRPPSQRWRTNVREQLCLRRGSQLFVLVVPAAAIARVCAWLVSSLPLPCSWGQSSTCVFWTVRPTRLRARSMPAAARGSNEPTTTAQRATTATTTTTGIMDPGLGATSSTLGIIRE